MIRTFKYTGTWLWRDRSLNELLEIKLFRRLDELYHELALMPALFRADEETVMNEVGRTLTWIVYESRNGFEPDMEQLEREIYARLGSTNDALTVMSLAYAAIHIINLPPLNISKYTKHELQKMIRDDIYMIKTKVFVHEVNKEGEFYDEKFLPYKEPTLETVQDDDDETIPWVKYDCESLDEEKKGRVFTLDEIVEYAIKYMTAESVIHVQLMLHTLMQKDSTKEEREKVSSIQTQILNRTAGDQVQGNKTSFGNYSNMVNFHMPENTDYDKFFAAMPKEMKDILMKQLTQKDNG